MADITNFITLVKSAASAVRDAVQSDREKELELEEAIEALSRCHACVKRPLGNTKFHIALYGYARLHRKGPAGDCD